MSYRTAASGTASLPRPAPGAAASFWAMMAVVFLAAMDATIVATALPAIVSDVGGAGLLSWVVTAYLLATAVTIPLWGKVADLADRRVLYVVATAVFLASSVAVALAPTMPVLLAARAVQGVGTGGLMALTPTIVGALFPAWIRGRYQGRQGAVLAASSIIGPLVGGLFVSAVGWRWAFWINVPLVAVALLVVLLRLRIPAAAARTGRRHLDVVGAILLTAAVLGLLLAVADGSPLAAAPVQLPLLVSAVSAAVLYAVWQRRARDPVLPLRLFRSRVVATAAMLSFVVGAAMLAGVVYAPLYAQAVLGRDAAAAGVLLLPLMVGTLIGNLLGGSLVTRSGRYRPVIIVGTSGVAAGYATLAATTGALGPGAAATVVLAVALASVGAGVGLTMGPTLLALQNASPAADLGAATGANTFARQLGQTLAVGMLGGVLAATAGPALADLAGGDRGGTALDGAREVVAAGLADVFLVAGVVGAVAVALALLLPERPLHAVAGEPSRQSD